MIGKGAVSATQTYGNILAAVVPFPTGEMSIQLSYSFDNQQLIVKKSGVMRTARLICKREAYF